MMNCMLSFDSVNWTKLMQILKKMILTGTNKDW